jgi:hypothetical protein
VRTTDSKHALQSRPARLALFDTESGEAQALFHHYGVFTFEEVSTIL